MHTRINRRSGGQRGRSPIPGCRPTRRYPVRMGDGSVGIASDLAPSGLLRAAINLGNPVLAQGNYGRNCRAKWSASRTAKATIMKVEFACPAVTNVELLAT